MGSRLSALTPRVLGVPVDRAERRARLGPPSAAPFPGPGVGDLGPACPSEAVKQNQSPRHLSAETPQRPHVALGRSVWCHVVLVK